MVLINCYSGGSLFVLLYLQCDHEELRNVLTQKKGAKGEQDAKSVEMFLRLKCTLTNRGRSVNIKSASFKVRHLLGDVSSGNLM